MSNKQPLEGLTVRIWDSDQDKKKSGSQGYREYTEIVGSDKLRHATHNWNKESKVSSPGLKKSTRDWEAEKNKLEKVQDLPLVSRSNVEQEPDKQGSSLKNVKLQHELWNHIMQKIKQIKDENNPKEWEPIVSLFRKLREGIYASNWSQGDYDFAIQVFENSVDCSIKGHNYQELVKSLYGLLDELYIVKNTAHQKKSYYTVLDILYHSCYIQNPKKAIERMTCLSQQVENNDSNEAIFGRKVIRSVLIYENPIQYFQLYYNNPYLTFKILMFNYNNIMRVKATEILRKAYLSTSLAWVGQWIGIYQDNGLVVSCITQLAPDCIKSIDYERQIVYFQKKRNK